MKKFFHRSKDGDKEIRFSDVPEKDQFVVGDLDPIKIVEVDEVATDEELEATPIKTAPVVELEAIRTEIAPAEELVEVQTKRIRRPPNKYCPSF